MNRKNTGFTLVEILIVVIILGILAAIVIPQFTEASNDARESALASDLQTLRSQLELYKVQHLDSYPPTTSSAVFTEQLLGRTNQDGTVMGAEDDAADFPFGPYLQKFPTNPFVSGATADDVSFGTAACPGDDTTGWYFNTTMGKISPNDNDGNHKDL